VLAEGLGHFPAHVRLRQLQALALARSGACRLASSILQQLVKEGQRDEETIGLLARTYKDLWAETHDRAQRRIYLESSFQHYRQAYETSAGYWSGVNAATIALLLDKRAESAALARQVREQCLGLNQTRTGGAERYWLAATLAEAALLLQAWEEAEGWYAKAAAIGRGRIGDIVSTRRNARLILRHMEADETRIDACFSVPPVVVFVGHLIDQPGRQPHRFPPWLEPAAREAIRRTVAALGPGIGYASAGCGGDILFLEALIDAGAEAHIVLPYGSTQFRADSVDVVPESDWGTRYDRVLERATEVVTASEQRMGSGAMSYEYGFKMLDGAAAVKADELETDLIGLALWDGEPGDGPGGTAASVNHWRGLNRRVEIIDLAAIRAANPIPIVETSRETKLETAPAAVGGPADGRQFDPQIVGLLFADVRGFSKLSDGEIPLFVERVLGRIGAEIARAPRPPLLANTWGDGLYLVFESVRETGEFALGLCEAVRSIDWQAEGFARDLALRIGLHAGPAYSCLDPVTGRPNYIGAHVSRAARIEPITPPGEVYASQAFASLARTEDVQSFVCAYVGQTPLAKGYGSYPTYVIHRRPTG
jgi:class 3 adenylate cyclase